MLGADLNRVTTTSGTIKDKKKKLRTSPESGGSKKEGAEKAFKSLSMVDLSTNPRISPESIELMLHSARAGSVQVSNTSTLVGHQRRNTIDAVMNGSNLSRTEVLIVIAIVLFIIAIVVGILLTPVIVFLKTPQEIEPTVNGIISDS